MDRDDWYNLIDEIEKRLAARGLRQSDIEEMEVSAYAYMKDNSREAYIDALYAIAYAELN